MTNSYTQPEMILPPLYELLLFTVCCCMQHVLIYCNVMENVHKSVEMANYLTPIIWQYIKEPITKR